MSRVSRIDDTPASVLDGQFNGRASTLKEVSFDGRGNAPRLGTPVTLIDRPIGTFELNVHPDGRFLFLDSIETDTAPDSEAPDMNGVVLVQDWDAVR